MVIAPLMAGFGSRITSVPAAYLLLWFGSLTLSIVLVVLLRTRWGQSRPLHKCAVLSLLVHLMLAWAAMTVRMVAGDGGGGVGPTIRVRIVQDPSLVHDLTSDVPTVAPELAPALLEEPEAIDDSPDQEQVAELERQDEPISAPNSATNLDQLTATEQPAAQPAAETQLPTDTIEQPASRANDKAEATAAASNPSETPASEVRTSAERAQVEVTQVATTSPLYAHRAEHRRLELVEQQGGSGQTEEAVASALRWLARSQSADGRWSASRFGAGQEHMVLGHNRGGAGRNADTGVTALALLAFLGAGHTHQAGEYQDTVRQGLDFLLRSQAADGSLFGGAALYAQMYCHSMATFALAEAAAVTGDRRLEPAIEHAVRYSVAAQNAVYGGWRYRPGDTGDTSQLGWKMMALASAERAGVEVAHPTWTRVDRFLQSVRHGAHGGLASYRPENGPSAAMTAEALYCRLLLADALNSTVPEASAAEASHELLSALPDAKRVNLYYWYYASLALHHRQHQSEAAANAWHVWNEAMTRALITTQVTSGQEAGSWDTNTVWGGYGGRAYTTAMAAMCLEVYYRYAPASSPWTASRSPMGAARR